MTYQEAMSQVPTEAVWSASFGYASEGGYVEYWRTPNGDRWRISNGSYLETAPFNWTVSREP